MGRAVWARTGDGRGGGDRCRADPGPHGRPGGLHPRARPPLSLSLSPRKLFRCARLPVCTRKFVIASACVSCAGAHNCTDVLAGQPPGGPALELRIIDGNTPVAVLAANEAVVAG